MGKNDFFLGDDDSQSLGDLNYMRMAKKVRRTFPKTLKNPNGFAIERSVSSSEGINFSDANNGFQAKSISNGFQSQINSSSESTPSVNSNSSSASTPRKVDTSMDMFLNMAKNIKKGR